MVGLRFYSGSACRRGRTKGISMPSSRGHTTTWRLMLASVLCGGLTTVSQADAPTAPSRETTFSLGRFGSIVSVQKTPRTTSGDVGTATGATAAGEPIIDPHPRPRLAGWAPFIAITTSDKRKAAALDDWEHTLHSSYSGNALSGDPSTDYIIGVLDSGAGVNLVAGSSAQQLGVTGSFLTSNIIPVGGIGETVDSRVTFPIGFFAAGFDAIDENGVLDLSQTAGHSNVAALAMPAVSCGGQEAVSALLGTAFIMFRNTLVSVDRPQKLVHGGKTFAGPTVELLSLFDPLPDHPRWIPLAVDGESPRVITAAYSPDIFNFDDFQTPAIPTQLSPGPFGPPVGSWFFTTMFLLEGEPSPTNIVQPFRMLVDTGAQSSIISTATAAALSLSLTPDFTVDICGVGGLVSGVPGYYIDFVKINAFGGALEFSRAPFIVIDLESPDGTGTLAGILGMNFFWNRNITLEPFLMGTSFLTVSDPIPFAAGDFNLDLFVDDVDLADLIACQSGPQIGLVGPECEHIDIGQNGTVDLRDVAALQRCFGGSETEADPNCGSD